MTNSQFPAEFGRVIVQLIADAFADALARPEVASALRAAVSTGESTPARRRLRRKEYAEREGVSRATVGRWIDEGMPTVPVGSTVRIDVDAADEWRIARGRKPTVARSAESDDGIDVTAVARRAGLRAIGGGR